MSRCQQISRIIKRKQETLGKKAKQQGRWKIKIVKRGKRSDIKAVNNKRPRNVRVWCVGRSIQRIGHIWSVTKRHFTLISELNQKQFKHWIISLNNLRFVLSWYISTLQCYFNNIGFLRKLQSERMIPFAPSFCYFSVQLVLATSPFV